MRRDNNYVLLNKFECYGEIMVTVLVKGRNGNSACVMTEKDYNKIITIERKYRKSSIAA